MAIKDVLERVSGKFPGWFYSSLVSERDRNVIRGPRPYIDPRRVLVIGTSVEDSASEVVQTLETFLKDKDVIDPVVKSEKMFDRIPGAFFNLPWYRAKQNGEPAEANEGPSLPMCVLVGTHIRGWLPERSMHYTEEIDKGLWEGEGVVLDIVKGLCKMYDVPLVRYDLSKQELDLSKLSSPNFPQLTS